jgi:hypothetical protein
MKRGREVEEGNAPEQRRSCLLKLRMDGRILLKRRKDRV